MGILSNLFGGNEEDGYNDWGSRLALAGQVLMSMDQGQPANIGPSIAALNAQRRKYADEIKSKKWLQNQAAAMADRNPRLAQMLQDAPPEIGQSLLSQYYQTLLQPPDWKTFESGGDIYRYNPLDPNSKPEVFFDGPDDPFKKLVNGILGEQGAASAPPAPATPTPTPTPDGVPTTPSAPGAAELPPTGGALSGQMKILAEAFGLPPNATPSDVMSVAQAGLMGEDNARVVAEAIRKRYETQQAQGIELTQKQNENAFKLQDDYWRVGSKYQEIMNAADSMSSVPDDPNGFERVMTMYKYMRALDPLGAVRESDAALAQSASGPYSRLEQLFSQYAGLSGSEIPRDAALEMKRLILEMGETASKADYKARKKTIARAKAMGIPEDRAEGAIFGGLQDDVDMTGYTPRFTPGPRSGGAQPAAGGSGEPVLEWTPNGGVQ